MCNKPPPTYICCAREYCNEKQNLHDDDNSNNDVRQSTIVIDRFDFLSFLGVIASNCQLRVVAHGTGVDRSLSNNNMGSGKSLPRLGYANFIWEAQG